MIRENECECCRKTERIFKFNYAETKAFEIKVLRLKSNSQSAAKIL